MATRTAVQAHPITGTLGAEVSGFAMADVDDDTIAELEVHPFTEGIDGYPEIVLLEAGGDTGKTFVAAGWHSDVTWRAEPSMGSILRGRDVPAVGGDTCFADATAAYERLSDEWKETVEGLTATHDYARVFGARVKPEEREAMREEYPPQHHPVIRTHPETGAGGIYTNIGFTSHVDDVEPEESDRILRHLERAIMDPSVQMRLRWRPDTFVMWDNRAVQHSATTDFLPAYRRMERVTIVGDRPF